MAQLPPLADRPEMKLLHRLRCALVAKFAHADRPTSWGSEALTFSTSRTCHIPCWACNARDVRVGGKVAVEEEDKVQLYSAGRANTRSSDRGRTSERLSGASGAGVTVRRRYSTEAWRRGGRSVTEGRGEAAGGQEGLSTWSVLRGNNKSPPVGRRPGGRLLEGGSVFLETRSGPGSSPGQPGPGRARASH
eukprot:765212-Hanusia_phi.AAC.3